MVSEREKQSAAELVSFSSGWYNRKFFLASSFLSQAKVVVRVVPPFLSSHGLLLRAHRSSIIWISAITLSQCLVNVCVYVQDFPSLFHFIRIPAILDGDTFVQYDPTLTSYISVIIFQVRPCSK